MKFSKKIVAISLALLLLVGVASSFAATDDRVGIRLGAGTGEIKSIGAPDYFAVKKFRKVRYVGQNFLGDTLTKDSVVVWFTGATTNDGVTVTTTTTSSDSTVAGIVTRAALTRDAGQVGNTAQQDYAKRNWTWLQTYGPAQIRLNASTAATAGAALGTGDVKGTGAEYNPVGPGRHGNAGFWLETTVGGQRGRVFLRTE